MGSLQKMNKVHAAGRYSAATPPVVEAAGTGNWSVARAGAGDCTVTLQDPIDLLERVVLATTRVTSTQVAVIAATETDTTFQVLCISDAAAATDTAVDFMVLRIRN